VGVSTTEDLQNPEVGNSNFRNINMIVSIPLSRELATRPETFHFDLAVGVGVGEVLIWTLQVP